MATANIRAVITAEDQASKVVKRFGDNVDDASDKATKSTSRINDNFNKLIALSVGAGVATHKLVGVMEMSIEASVKQQNAFTGLNSLAKAYGQNTDEARKSAERLAKDGLMTVADAATGLKNLLASGFSLPQAVTLMERFKDSAAFARQGSLSFGEAVRSATEGIKNGNSILVDNAGVTKNLSVILEEAGFSAQDLMRATTDANVRQALFNGIIKETNAQMGDAQRLTDSAAGAQARHAAQVENLKARLGDALLPALTQVLQVLTPLVEKFAKFATDHPNYVAAFLIIGTAVTALIAGLGTLGIAVMGVSTALGALAGPIAAVVVGLGATTASVGALTLKWEELSPVVRTAVALVGGQVGLLIYNARIIYDAFNNAWNGIITGAQRVYNFIKGLNWSDLVAGISKGIGNSLIGNIERALKSALSILPGGLENRISIPRFDSGGVVPGAIGQPQLAVVHGGETVLPTHKTGENFGTSNVNISVNVGVYAGSEMEKRRIASELFSSLKDVALSQNKSVSQMLGS